MEKTAFEQAREELWPKINHEGITLCDSLGISQKEFDDLQRRAIDHMNGKGRPESVSQEIEMSLEIANNLTEFAILAGHFATARMKMMRLMENLAKDPKAALEMMMKR